MSYILDALKRADAERGRGAVPGLHTRQLPNPSESNAAAPGARSALWLGLAGGLVLASVAGGLWLWQKPAQAPVALVTQPVVAAAPASAAPELNSTRRATPPTTAVTSATPAAPRNAPLAPVTAVPEASARVKSKPTPARAAPAVARPVPTPTAPKTAAQAAPAAGVIAAPASAPSAAVPLLSELPDELRQQVPAMTVTGAVYAANPAQRLLLVNNLVLTQGALVAPEVTLEEIRPRSSVFSFRGTRFRVAH